MQAARRIKLPEEIELLEEATALADAVTASATAAVADGVRECEVAGEAMRTLFRLGGEYAHVMTPFVASGENMAPPHRICSDKLIRHGDIVFIDIGACWSGYFGDVARAVICGKPSDEQRKIYSAVYHGLKAGIAEMRPGRTNKDAAEALIRSRRQIWARRPHAVALHRAWRGHRRERAALYRGNASGRAGLRIRARHGVRCRAAHLGRRASAAAAGSAWRRWCWSPRARRT